MNLKATVVSPTAWKGRGEGRSIQLVAICTDATKSYMLDLARVGSVF